MRGRTLIVVAVVMAATTASPGGPAPANKKDMDKLHGTWLLHSGTKDGEVAPADEVAKVKIAVEGDKITLWEDRRAITANVKLNAVAKPPAIDIGIRGGKQNIKGIYELDGDTLKLCLALPGNDRPKEFVSQAGSGTRLMTLKREKK
jgi:uncharacterized protein (TIGR03067 family)